MTLRLIGLADDHPVIMDALASKLAESGSFAVADLWQKFSLERRRPWRIRNAQHDPHATLSR